MVQTIISKRPNLRARPRMLAIDENCNQPTVDRLTHQLISDGLISACFPMWDQARIRNNGTWIHVRAGVVDGGPPGYDWGKPVEHVSFSDEEVVQMLFVHLIYYDIVFISEDKGIRRLIRKEAELLQTPVQLVALYKKGKISWDEYCNILRKKIEAWTFKKPFHAEEITLK